MEIDYDFTVKKPQRKQWYNMKNDKTIVNYTLL